MNQIKFESSLDPKVARLIDANIDRAREGLRVIEEWCRFGLDRKDLVITIKNWRQQLGHLHHYVYKEARSTASDIGAGLSHTNQLNRLSPNQIVSANCARVQEALRVLEEFSRNINPKLSSEASTIRYGLYDLEVTCLKATYEYKRRKSLQNCNLCLITMACDDLKNRVEAALRCGVGMVQYRCKKSNDREKLHQAYDIKNLCYKYNALFIINDRIDIALAVDADGIHLGQKDLPTYTARKLIGSEKIIGRSTHNLEQVKQANEEECDYLGFGPINSTMEKSELTALDPSVFQQALHLSHLPVFAIGGINSTNLRKVTDMGFRHVAVISAIMKSNDPYSSTKNLMKQLSESK